MNEKQPAPAPLVNPYTDKPIEDDPAPSCTCHTIVVRYDEDCKVHRSEPRKSPAPAAEAFAKCLRETEPVTEPEGGAE